MELRYVLLLIMSLILVTTLTAGLSHDPYELPSSLVGEPTLTFRLATLESTAGPFTPRDLRDRVWMLNVWAPWYTACRIEHVVLSTFAKQSVVLIYSLNYKGDADTARAWLKQMGNPHVTSLIDVDDKVGTDHGVYSVPETPVIGCVGVVRYRQVGPVTAGSMERRIVPLLQRLEQEGSHV